MNTQRIDEITAELEQLAERRNQLRKERDALRDEDVGIVRGETIVRVPPRGRRPATEYLVTKVTHYGSFVSLHGRKRKQDGGWGKAESYVYGDWEIVGSDA